MTRLRYQVTEFHSAFGQPVADAPALPSVDRLRLRLRLIGEEYLELLEACGAPVSSLGLDKILAQSIEQLGAAGEPDLVGIVDAIEDIGYVLEGTRIELGYDGEPVSDEVHRSNMAKVGASTREDGKIQKPAGWTPPDIAGCLRAQGWVGK